MSDTRLIERWLPIGAIGEESSRERRSMTALPPVYYLHVWWARRPLVASRAAVLAALLPESADRNKFLRAMGIHGDPVASRRRIHAAKRSGQRFEGEAYSYPRAYSYILDSQDHAWIASEREQLGIAEPSVLDPTAGGGAIPFEATRLRFAVFSNDLNPVACLIEQATIDFPARFGVELVNEFDRIAKEFVRRRDKRLGPVFPKESDPNVIPTNYLWARTITCPYCNGVVPLSPNWRLASDGTGLKLRAHLGSGDSRGSRFVEFQIVKKAADQSKGTIGDGDAICPFPDCNRQIDGDEVKKQAQAGEMGEQLMAVVYKRRIETRTKSGKVGRDKWERGFRAPGAGDNVQQELDARLEVKKQEWETRGVIPTEAIGELSNYDRGHRMYGMYRWLDMFSPRQLFSHGTAVEVSENFLKNIAHPAA